MKIPQEVITILSQSNVTDNILYLPERQLGRQLYVSVNKCLEMIGGKWNRKIKGHIFNNNISDILDEMINTGEVADIKKEYQFFPTPKNIVTDMLSMVTINKNDILMEPSAGQGNILDEFPKENSYIAVELMPENCNILRNKGYTVIQNDFLLINDHADIIIMNPPFSKQQDIKHIKHAWSLLNAGGTLISIVSESPFFRITNEAKDFRSWLTENNADIIDLNSGDFKTSGTNVKTRIIKVIKK